MCKKRGQHRGIDYQVETYPGDGYTGWVAVLSKDGRPIKEVDGISRSPGGVPENAPVCSAVQCEIDAEFDLAASGQSPWGSMFS